MSFWKNKPLIITIILGIVLVVLLFATSGHNAEEGNSSLVGRIIEPMQEGIFGTTQSTTAFFERLFGTSDLNKENLELREKVSQLQSQLRDYNTIAKENQRLKELLNFKETTDYDVVTAKVIGKNSGQWFEEFTVNVGAADGVKEEMIVMNESGLVGKVTQVYDSYSKIITLMHTEMNVPVMVERSRDYGVVKTISDSKSKATGKMRVEYMSTGADVVPGDTVVTSGMGGMYPKGLYIGVVSEVSMDVNSEAVVILQSNVDFEHLEEIVIILEVFEEVEQ